MTASSCDEDRLRQTRQAKDTLDAAQKLVREDRLDEALELFLLVFDNSADDHKSRRVLIDFWLGMEALSEKYVPAKKAMQSRRDTREKMIREGERDHGVVSEWLELNKHLRETEHGFALLNQLEMAGTLDEDLRQHIISANFDQLLAQKRYTVLGEYLDEFGHKFMSKVFLFELESLFPDKASSWSAVFSAMRLREEGVKVYELALGSKKIVQADEVAKRLLLHCNDAESFQMLIGVALRTGNKMKAKQLLAKARISLSECEYLKVQDSL